jgi:hypothetical protein
MQRDIMRTKSIHLYDSRFACAFAWYDVQLLSFIVYCFSES